MSASAGCDLGPQEEAAILTSRPTISGGWGIPHLQNPHLAPLVGRRAERPSSHPPGPSVLRAIPYLSKHRADRMKRLGDFLNLESFDLALLQEVGCGGPVGGAVAADFPEGRARRTAPFPRPPPQVWSEQDFQYLRQKLLPTYPSAHYFRR